MTRENAIALRALLVKAAASLSNSDALQCKEFFDAWADNTKYPIDKRLRYNGDLWRVRQPHTSSNLYPPGSTGSEALYEQVAEPGQGDTPENPIQYNNNMKLFEGKYYLQDGVTYYCFRSTGAAVYNPLSALIDIYVRIVQ